MKASCFILIASSIFLGGCQTTKVAPVQVGRDKFELSFGFEGSASAKKRAQKFCRDKGFDYAEVTWDLDYELTFFCMRNGEKLNRPPMIVFPPFLPPP